MTSSDYAVPATNRAPNASSGSRKAFARRVVGTLGDRPPAQLVSGKAGDERKGSAGAWSLLIAPSRG